MRKTNCLCLTSLEEESPRKSEVTLNISNVPLVSSIEMKANALKADIAFMRRLLPKKKKINKQVMLFSVNEEDTEQINICRKTYIRTFETVFIRIRKMSIDKKLQQGSYW